MPRIECWCDNCRKSKEITIREDRYHETDLKGYDKDWGIRRPIVLKQDKLRLWKGVFYEGSSTHYMGRERPPAGFGTIPPRAVRDESDKIVSSRSHELLLQTLIDIGFKAKEGGEIRWQREVFDKLREQIDPEDVEDVDREDYEKARGHLFRVGLGGCKDWTDVQKEFIRDGCEFPRKHVQVARKYGMIACDRNAPIATFNNLVVCEHWVPTVELASVIIFKGKENGLNGLDLALHDY